MEAIVLKPEKEQTTVWYLCWGIPFAIGSVFLAALMLAASPGFAFALGGWLVIMLCILAWIPAYYRSLGYVIDNEAVRSKGGVFWRKHVTVPFVMITHVDVTQGPLERAFEIGAIHVQTAGAGGAEATKAELKLVGIRDLEGVKEAVMERIRSHRTSGVIEAAQKGGQQAGPEIPERMLEELAAIRQALEKRQN